MRFVITGATGNIGTALLWRLLADGEHELVGLAPATAGPGAAHRGAHVGPGALDECGPES